MSNNTAAVLKGYADRKKRLLDEIDAIKADLKEIDAEIKGAGFNLKALNKLIAISRKDTADDEAAFLNDLLLYAGPVGVQLDLALPEAA